MNTKTVLITGGTSGIGLELAKLFAQDKYRIILVARGQQGLNAAAATLRAEAADIISISKDLSDPHNAFAVYEEIKSRNIQVDVLVNNAGQGQYGEFINTDIQRELSIIQLNICSLVVLTKLFLKDMVKRGEGKILNLSSVASKSPGPLQSVYHATKAFVQSFTEAIHNEVKDKGITVTALLPGATETDFFRKAGMTNAKNVKEGKLAKPEEVAEDGYKALMNGDDKVISGFRNKIQVALSNILPEAVVAAKVHEKQKPADGK